MAFWVQIIHFDQFNLLSAGERGPPASEEVNQVFEQNVLSVPKKPFVMLTVPLQKESGHELSARTSFPNGWKI